MKKKYWLALWWGAAKWLAHIWVLKYIEKKNILISEISGTSIWAIIWWLYSIWKSSTEITKIIENINFLKLIDINLKKSIISWDKIYDLLCSIFWDLLIENCKIPLKIIATNLETWKKNIFTKWKIVDAIRSSICLPTIFKPYKIWINTYLDWWLTSNLPISELNQKNIIACSVIREKKKHKPKEFKEFLWLKLKTWFWHYNYEILKRTFFITMKTNEDYNLLISQKTKNITLIEPDVWDYEFYDFMLYKEIIKIWYEEFKNIN